MARPERNRTARSFRQLKRFHRFINSDQVFGTHRSAGANKNRSRMTAPLSSISLRATLLSAITLLEVESPFNEMDRWHFWGRLPSPPKLSQSHFWTLIILTYYAGDRLACAAAENPKTDSNRQI